MQFDDDTMPDTSRTVNPYDDIIKSIAGTKKADSTPVVKSFTVAGKTDEDPEVLKARRLLTEAGKKAGVTVRSKYDILDGTDAGKVKIRFWTVSKIKRKPKTGASDATATTTVPVTTTPVAKSGKK